MAPPRSHASSSLDLRPHPDLPRDRIPRSPARRPRGAGLRPRLGSVGRRFELGRRDLGAVAGASRRLPGALSSRSHPPARVRSRRHAQRARRPLGWGPAGVLDPGRHSDAVRLAHPPGLQLRGPGGGRRHLPQPRATRCRPGHAPVLSRRSLLLRGAARDTAARARGLRRHGTRRAAPDVRLQRRRFRHSPRAVGTSPLPAHQLRRRHADGARVARSGAHRGLRP